MPITPEIALESVKLPNCEHKDLVDRFIIATARIAHYTIVTRDQKILGYAAIRS